MSDYKVKSNLRHNGKDFKKGDVIDLDEATAEALLNDNIIVDVNAEDVEDEEIETPQPPVNEVKREGDQVDGEVKVEPGTVEKPQPGDNQDNENNEPVKSQYKVLQGLEYPQGTVHEVDAVLELTDEEASNFAEGLIAKVDDNL